MVERRSRWNARASSSRSVTSTASSSWTFWSKLRSGEYPEVSASGPASRDRADERLDAPVVAAQLEDLLDDRAILGLELAGALVGGDAVLSLLDLDEQPALRVGLGRAGDTAVQAFDRDGDGAAGQPDAVGHARDGADCRVLALVLRHEQDAILVADVDRQRHVHVREDDDVVERDEQQLGHVRSHSSAVT